MWKIGKTLDRMRRDAAIGVAEFRERLGAKSDTSVYSLEREDSNPTWNKIVAHVTATGAEPADLIWEMYKNEARPWPKRILREQMRMAGIDPDHPEVGRSDLEEAADHLEQAGALVRKAGGSVRAALALSEDDPETPQD